MPVPRNGAQRASIQPVGPADRPRHRDRARRRRRRRPNPTPAAAAGMKVVVIVGPVGSSTANYITTPSATPRRPAPTARPWSRSTARTRPGPGSRRRPRARRSSSTSATATARPARTAPSPGTRRTASGSTRRPATATATRSITASTTSGPQHQAGAERGRHPQPPVLRLGQLRVGLGRTRPRRSPSSASTTTAPASCAPAPGRSSPRGSPSASYILYGLFKTNRTIGAIFKSSSNWSGAYDFKFQSSGTPGYTAWMDPKTPGRYYRSVIGNLGLTRGDVPRQLTPPHARRNAPPPVRDPPGREPIPCPTPAGARLTGRCAGRRDNRAASAGRRCGPQTDLPGFHRELPDTAAPPPQSRIGPAAGGAQDVGGAEQGELQQDPGADLQPGRDRSCRPRS